MLNPSPIVAHSSSPHQPLPDLNQQLPFVLLESMEESDLVRHLNTQGYALFIEPCRSAEALQREIAHVGKAERFYSFQTRSAYQQPVAKILADFFIETARLSLDQGYKLHTALHELVINAMMHGNLELSSAYRTVNELYDTLQLMERLVQGEKGDRRIRVTYTTTDQWLEITVEDEGEGFDFTSYQSPETHAISGRGIMVVQSSVDRLTYSDAGRKAHIWMARSGR
jgi:anti-sigma regulatory factor (Ser/Thr protein kinase)